MITSNKAFNLNSMLAHSFLTLLSLVVLSLLPYHQGETPSSLTLLQPSGHSVKRNVAQVAFAILVFHEWHRPECQMSTPIPSTLALCKLIALSPGSG
jgi:hypothetical protein